MTKVHFIFYVGISGSGKSYQADQYIANHPEAIKIERDEIREQLYPGYWRGTPDDKKERVVTSEADTRIKNAIAEGFTTIVVSDTNLNQKYVDRLLEKVRQSGVEVIVGYSFFDDSLDLQLCIERNYSRQRYVNDTVICEQWRRYQRLRGSKEKYVLDTSKRPVLFVSDLHGEFGKLKPIMHEYNKTYDVVLLGDLNDQRYENVEDNFNSKVSSYSSVKYVKERIKNEHSYSNFGRLLCLQSNHQKNLINLLRGRRKKLAQGLQNTAAEFVGVGVLDVEIDCYKNDVLYISKATSTAAGLDIANFLDTLPACIRMNHNGEEWRSAHAFVPDFESSFEPYPLKNELFIYGPNHGHERGYPWWEDIDKKESVPFKQIVGHSHNIYLGKNIIVNDPDEQGRIGLVFFEPDKEPYFVEI